MSFPTCNKVTISFRDVLHVNLITFQPWSPIWACNSSLFGACLSCPAGELRCISWSWQICDIFLSNDLYNLVQLYCSRQTFFFFFCHVISDFFSERITLELGRCHLQYCHFILMRGNGLLPRKSMTEHHSNEMFCWCYQMFVLH